MATRTRSTIRHLVAARRPTPRRRRPHVIGQAAARREGRRARSRTSRAAFGVLGPGSGTRRPHHRVDLPRPGADHLRSATARGHGMAPGGRPAGDVVRSRGDGRQRARPSRRQTSYTNIAYGLTPAEFSMSTLRDIYGAALGYQSMRPTSNGCSPAGTSSPGPAPPHLGQERRTTPALYRFTDSRLRITDEFAALRPPMIGHMSGRPPDRVREDNRRID